MVFWSTHPLSNKSVQPACVNIIVLEGSCFQQRNEIFHCGSEVTSDAQLFEGYDKISEKLQKLVLRAMILY